MTEVSSLRADRAIAVVLAGVVVLLRVPGLRALPIFGDEAIHIHWAQLVRENPVANAFVSMQDPKPPFHFWLLAVALPLSRDPILAGRLVSVLCGALSTGIFFLLARDLAGLAGASDRTARASAFWASALFALCPFLAFYQRMVLSESLFVLEAVTAGWLSLRVARAAAGGRSIRPSVALGIVLGLAMLTRQNFSYALWALPALAALVVPGTRPAQLVRALAAATVCALLLWSPVLLSRIGPDWRTRVFHQGVYREPIGASRRGENAIELARWFAVYLTPPVLLFSAAALAWLTMRRRRAGVFLWGWSAAALGPLVLLASFLFPRYALVGTVPLLVAAGLFAAALAEMPPPRLRAAAGALLGLTLLAWPAADLARGFSHANLLPIDRWQYVTGWPAGGATECAATFLLEQPGPIVVIVPEISGNPGDALWVLLRKHSAVTVHTAVDYLDGPILAPTPGGFLLREDFREMKPAASVALPRDASVFFVCTDPLATRAGWVSAEPYLQARNPGIQTAARFSNPRDPARGEARIVVFRLR